MKGEQEVQPTDAGSVPAGCIIATGMQALCLLGGVLLSFSLPLGKGQGPFSMYTTIALCTWGLTQWIGVVPAAFYFKRKGQKSTVAGLLVMGGIGLLLNSACVSYVFQWPARSFR